MYQRILVPVDGSDTSTRGLSEAIKLAKEQAARLRILHVVCDPFVSAALMSAGYSPDLLPRLQAEGQTILDAAEAAARKHGVEDVEATLLDYRGAQIAEAIIAEAKSWRADLIIMGTHGRRGFARAVMGSDAEYVVRHAPVPLLLIRS